MRKGKLINMTCRAIEIAKQNKMLYFCCCAEKLSRQILQIKFSLNYHADTFVMISAFELPLKNLKWNLRSLRSSESKVQSKHFKVQSESIFIRHKNLIKCCIFAHMGDVTIQS